MAKSYDDGLKAEQEAESFLVKKGYTILARRFKGNGGELDLIATKEQTVSLVEVRFRKTISDAAESITPLKRTRLYKVAEYFLSQNTEICEKYPFIRFDVVLLSKDGSIMHIEDVFGGFE